MKKYLVAAVAVTATLLIFEAGVAAASERCDGAPSDFNALMGDEIATAVAGNTVEAGNDGYAMHYHRDGTLISMWPPSAKYAGAHRGDWKVEGCVLTHHIYQVDGCSACNYKTRVLVEIKGNTIRFRNLDKNRTTQRDFRQGKSQRYLSLGGG